MISPFFSSPFFACVVIQFSAVVLVSWGCIFLWKTARNFIFLAVFIAAINATRRLPWTKGTVLIAPCDINWYFEHDELDFPKRLPERARRILETNEDLYENACRIHDEYSFSAAADDIKERNLLFIRCALDEALPMDNATPLFRKLDSYGPCGAVRKIVMMNTDHAFNDSKNLMAKVVIDWLAGLINK